MEIAGNWTMGDGSGGSAVPGSARVDAGIAVGVAYTVAGKHQAAATGNGNERETCNYVHVQCD